MKETSPTRVICAVAGSSIQMPRGEVRNLIGLRAVMEGEFHGIVPIGIDVAKKLLAVHGVVMNGRSL
jgi:hypothetical protein